MRKKRLMAVALFLLLIFGGFFVYKTIHKPQMTIIVKFGDTPPILQNFPRRDITVYYRGYKVGDVSKVELSGDQKYILFYVEINYKNLKLPKNIDIILKTEDLYGARYFSISYPKNPSSQLLSDGDVMEGTAAYERLDKYLIAEFETGKLKILLDNMLVLTEAMKGALKSNNGELLSEIKKSSSDIGIILSNLREIIDDPQVKSDIKSTIKYSSSSIKELDQIIQSKEIKQIITTAPETINKTVTNLESLSQNMPIVNKNILEVTKTVDKTNSSLSVTNCNLDKINKKVPEIPSSLLNKADNALTKFDCIGSELIELLNKRFLVFRFMFGKPGSPFERC
ncbi:MAG: MlaD family protein, partial [Candidatus Gastranaerophilales bacterium]|nr:MlaD family protein [Candidatus Gastranaerophilales bacterium]